MRHKTPARKRLSSARQALSEVFVDNQVNYRWIAQQLEGYSLEEVERLFYQEVAPVCYSNLLTPAPPVWKMFDPQWLEEEIEKRIAAKSRGRYAAFKQKILCGWLRYACFDHWQALKKELDALRNQHS